MKKYTALTLLELIIVMVIIFILSIVSILTYRSLVDSFSINEVSLTIAQDIRKTQRAAMLLDRESDERWLHGIGIDFREINTEPSDPLNKDIGRKYTIFKWCSPHNYYDENKTDIAGELPDEGRSLPWDDEVDSCPRGQVGNVYYPTRTISFAQYNNLEFELLENVAFILFESVSGKAFLYDLNGVLLNYEGVGTDNISFLMNSLFNLEIRPMRGIGLASRNIKVTPVSGIAYFEIDN